MIVFISSLFIITLLYIFIIFSYTYYIRQLEISTNFPIDNFRKVSIIIPARNESYCIIELLRAIKNQDYPVQFYEIIVIDDASTDNTAQLVHCFADGHPEINCKIIKIENDILRPTYKKFAIGKGIQIATGELIITTDADCVAGPGWISGIVNKYNKTKAKMLVGLVAYHDDDTNFQKIQHLEFLSLIASSIAAVKSGYPIMCNGANLTYERKAFDEVNGFDSNDQFASGDDVFLLLKMKKHFGRKSIVVLDDRNTIVYTKAKKNLSEFIHQRIRWASKTKGYKDPTILLVAGIVFAFNVSIILTFLSGFVLHQFLILSFYLFSIKLIVDFPIMVFVCKYLNRNDLLRYYVPLQLIYLPYVLLIGIISNFVSYQWKGRIIKK
ncbi:MAG: glycosyltransferase [Bacteroidales bacterium]